MDNFAAYLKEIEKAFQSKIATEHTYRHSLISLIESFGNDIEAINEPKRRTFGAPDYVIRKREIPLGYIEAKDVGKDLDKLDKREKEQLKKYLDSLNNIIYTNYLDFRWYVRGEVVQTITLAEFDANGNLQPKADAEIGLTNLFKEFLNKHIETVATPKELAKRMASITRLIRQTIEKALADEETTKQQTLHEQFESFKKTLLPNLDDKGFADLYSQTIAYGLFTARCFDNKPPFTRQEAAYLVPKTNPFLRDTFDRIAGIHLDERITWAVDDLAELLNRTDISAILQDFGKRTRQEDPVVHFYETFLSEYDPKLRETRGVYYTPEPVVSYIVRSVDKILQTDFGLSKGLADSSKLDDGSHRVLILDPATGTGTFLYNVIKNIWQRIQKFGGWDSYVSKHLLPRIFGFELLVAPYAIAHLKLGLLLEETGYRIDKDDRLRIYLNNTLDFVALKEEKPDTFSAFINREASAAREIQQDKPVMVILGNPPYSGHSANTGKWINDLLRGADSLNDKPTENYFMVNGEPLGERNPKYLNDDYVKFIRFAQWRIDQTGYGVLAFVTNHGYLDNPTFRGMRQSLMKTFDEIYVLDLHGNAKKKERSPDNSKDENVFDIQQGVSIGIFVKKLTTDHRPLTTAKVFHKHLYGVREIWTENVNDEKELTGGKYQWLTQNDISTTEWKEIEPVKPFYLFTQQDATLRDEYEGYWAISNIMNLSANGVKTHRDHFAISFDKNDLLERINDLRETKFSDEELRKLYKLEDNRDWQLTKARKQIRLNTDWQSELISLLYRPFDWRSCYFSKSVVDFPRREFVDHVAKKDNLCLCLGRQGIAVNEDFWDLITVSNLPIDTNAFRRGGVSAFPLYLYPTEKRGLFDEQASVREPNFSNEFIKDFSAKLKLAFVLDGKGDLETTFAPEDIFNYAYAVFHSPTYRARYAEFLKIDFPRLPLTSNFHLFFLLARLGELLVELHLLEKDIESEVTFPEKGSNAVEFVKFIGGSPQVSNGVETADNTLADARVSASFGKVFINKTQYFDNVPETVWNFHIGGYQVLQKWLKDRKGRTLLFDDLEHYAKVVSALSQTIELMQKIDETIEENGGFPIE
ncbi:MAG: N-6 DNA methylase [Acidobacteria bacterium]|nr:N-6 DNA methylase [Acidobacteriota bacterium]